MPDVNTFVMRSHTVGDAAPIDIFPGRDRLRVWSAGDAGLGVIGASLLSSIGWKADGAIATSLPTDLKSPGLKGILPLCSLAMSVPYGAGTPAVGLPLASTVVTMTRCPFTMPIEPIAT